MIDMVISESRKILFKACERYAEANKTNVENVQIILGLDANGEMAGNTYTMCIDYAPKEVKEFLGVLGVKIAFGMNAFYAQVAPPFITKALMRFAEKYGVEMVKIKVMCVPCRNEKNKPDIQLFIYNGNEYLETIEFPDLFREEDIQMPTSITPT